MPFTLAHPAAVFPLKRIKWLPLIPLIVGSMAPDLAEFLPQALLERMPLSHSRPGLVVLDLPFGLVLVGLLVALQIPLTAPLWEPHRSFIRAAVKRLTVASRWWLLTAAPAVFVGACTHLLWDSFTHRGHWVVRHFPFLQRPLTPDGEHIWEVFHVLQYLSSAFGLAVIAAWYVFELRKSGLVGTGRIWRKCLLGACVIASLGIGVLVFSAQPNHETFSNYLTFSIVLECAMGAFALLYLAAGLVISATQAFTPSAKQSIRTGVEGSG
jgi:hypothetical protein